MKGIGKLKRVSDAFLQAVAAAENAIGVLVRGGSFLAVGLGLPLAAVQESLCADH